MRYHIPVLLHEAIDGLKINPGGIYVDLTYGSGGHAKEILKRLTTGILYAFDSDIDAAGNLSDEPQMVFIHDNFRHVKNNLKYHSVEKVDGIIADLGVSSHQIDCAERGFSLRMNAKLDMRMDSGNGPTAEMLLNEYDENALRYLFYNYGEIGNSSLLVKNILKIRKSKRIATTEQLKDAAKSCAPKGRENQYFAKVFQTLRIAVNDELGALKEMLLQVPALLKNKGRLVVLSYHSLEDRIVKRFMKTGNTEGILHQDEFGNHLVPFRVLTKKPVTPTMEELMINPRARSAKMRIAELL